MKKLLAVLALLGLGMSLVGCADETKVETPDATVTTGSDGTTVTTDQGTEVKTDESGTTVETPAEGTTPAEGATPAPEGDAPAATPEKAPE